MPKRNMFALFAAVFVLFAVPAHADGYADRPVQRGPEPLRAQVPVQPAPDCELIGGDEWYCPPDEPAPHQRAEKTPIQTVSAPSGLTIDIAGFDGGVGAGVGSGYYGGGGRVIVHARARSSARAYATASVVTRFRGGFSSGGGCNVCGH